MKKQIDFFSRIFIVGRVLSRANITKRNVQTDGRHGRNRAFG
jgi:hypothetical protein